MWRIMIGQAHTAESPVRRVVSAEVVNNELMAYLECDPAGCTSPTRDHPAHAHGTHFLGENPRRCGHGHYIGREWATRVNADWLHLDDPEDLIGQLTATNRRQWEEVSTRVTPAVYRRLRGLYNSSGRYATELLNLANREGLLVTPNGPRNGVIAYCLTHLDRGNHRCNGGPTCIHVRDFHPDHVVMLRDPDTSRWAMLSQPYGRRDGEPEAPYGHGTALRLYRSSEEARAWVDTQERNPA